MSNLEKKIIVRLNCIVSIVGEKPQSHQVEKRISTITDKENKHFSQKEKSTGYVRGGKQGIPRLCVREGSRGFNPIDQFDRSISLAISKELVA
ncbi:hypothetical protein CEXT_407411 [Caerostris extrusa]|uniref:Uncharacterized protein n=1 Tax=Caerostris extrusa TaxID=172846 RepID=A0AAV4QUB3_CAEEX|nr:hypothetical protein CEXT_407411 [Caerostris extrusa]